MQTLSNGQLANKLFSTREKIRALNAKIEVLKAEYHALEEIAIEQCTNQGINQFRGPKATVSFKTVAVPRAADWTKFHKYIYQNKALHLLEKRIAVVPWRDEVASRRGNRPLPGVDSFDKNVVSVTVVK